ncbi:MAG TPA: M56 family metallopeptidase [Puia sp.]|jgi:beta-lactamase regulating signal transducer with metallopeptidase domain|nr:M56 family metallopeptidase [Puia sp.]
MDTLVSYLIRSAAVSGLMLGYYHLALRNRKSHLFNRAWLLTSLLASLILPLIHIKWLTWNTTSRPMTVLITGMGAHPAAAKAFSVLAVAAGVCAAVSAVLLVILGLRILRVYRLRRGHETQRIEGCLLIEVQDRRAPFSFLKNLFWQEGADIHDPVQRKILDHELAHIRGGHTYDNLFAQSLAAVFWMNPFYWLIRRELQMVHEFIADDASIASGDLETFARMLLQAYDGGRYLDPSHSFYFSPIKRRLHMINSSKSPSRWRMAMALPVLLAVMALACSKEQQAQPEKAVTIRPAIQLTAMKKVDTLRISYLNKDGTTRQFVVFDRASLAKITIDGHKVPPPPPKIGEPQMFGAAKIVPDHVVFRDTLNYQNH